MEFVDGLNNYFSYFTVSCLVLVFNVLRSR